MQSRASISVRVDPELMAKVRAIAEKDDRTVANLVRYLMICAVEKRSPKFLADAGEAS